VKRIARAALEILRLAVARDRLPPPPPAPPESPRGSHGVLHVLFLSREPLGLEPEPPRRRRSVLRALFAPEKLDDAP
jgi:hypothetical protein